MLRLNIFGWAAFLVGFLSLADSSARAAVLFKNNNQLTNSVTRLQNTTDRAASDFSTFSLTSVVQSAIVTVFNNNLSGFTAHNFTLSIYTDNGGVPGTVVGTFQPFQISVAQSVQTKLTTTTDPAGISLAANTTYWGVMQVNETASTEFAGWYRTTTQNVDAGSAFTTLASTQVLSSANSGSTWSNAIVGNSMFQLDGLAPEPSMLTPLFLTVAMLLRRKANRRVG